MFIEMLSIITRT